MVAHTFNPAIWEAHAFKTIAREVETGVIWLGREEYKAEGDRNSDSLRQSEEQDSLRFGGDRCSLEMQSENRITDVGFPSVCCESNWLIKKMLGPMTGQTRTRQEN